jgi:hypothetical protein
MTILDNDKMLFELDGIQTVGALAAITPGGLVEFSGGSEEKDACLAGPPVTLKSDINPALKKVMLTMPWHKSTNPMTAFCMMSLVDRRRTALLLNFGDAFVAHARNSCADILLSSKYDWMLTIDDDMLVPFGNAGWFNAHSGLALPEKFAGLHAMDRLLSHNKTLVGGLYFGRHKFGPPLYSEGINNPQEMDYARKAPHDVCKPTKWVATGCLLIHRSVFEDIEKKFPRLGRNPGRKGGNWFSTSEHNSLDYIDQARSLFEKEGFSGETAHRAFALLESAAAAGRSQSTLGMGEDVQFCMRAIAAGHQPYVDMGLVCGHIGHAVYGPRNTSRRPLR